MTKISGQTKFYKNQSSELQSSVTDRQTNFHRFRDFKTDFSAFAKLVSLQKTRLEQC